MTITTHPFDLTDLPRVNRIADRMVGEMPDYFAVLLLAAFARAIVSISTRQRDGEWPIVLTLHEAALFSALSNEDMGAVIRLIEPKERA